MKELKFYSVRETAEILKVHTITVKRLIKNGKLKGKLIGNRYRIDHRSLENFIN